MGDNASVKIPTQSYRVRVVGTEFGTSNSGNPKTTLKCEIIEPEAVDINGEQVRVAGLKFPMWLTHVPHLVGDQRTSSQAQVFELMDKLGISELMDVDENGEYKYDTDQHKEYFLGCEFDIVLTSVERIKRARITPEEKAKGVKLGKAILDGEGKEIKDGYQIQASISDVLADCRPSRTEMAY